MKFEFNCSFVAKCLMFWCICILSWDLNADITSLARLISARAHCPVILRASDFGTTGTVIDQPGYYKLCNDVEFVSGTAIDIRSSYVTIDLNSKAIYGAGLDVGITVTSSIHDVVIKDGVISEFGSYGIFVNQGCHKIFIEHLNINKSKEPCTNAIVLNGVEGNTVHECGISYCKINEINSPVVVDFNYCDDIEVFGSSFNKNLYTTGLSVVDAIFSDKCHFIKCYFNDNEVTGTGFLNCVTTVTCTSCEIDHCTFNNNKLPDGDLRCVYLNAAKGTLIKESMFANNQSASSTQGQSGLCVAIDDLNGESDKIFSCIITNNSVTTTLDSTDANVYGIRVTGTDSQNCCIEKCLITQNNSNASGSGSIAHCYGIYFDDGSKHNLSDCTLLSNSATPTETSVGVGIYNSSSSPVIQKSSIFGNSHYGIYNAAEAIIVSCNSGYNGADYGGAAGFIPNSTGVTKLGDNVTTVQQFENSDIWV